MDYPLKKRGHLLHPGDPINASDHYSMSKQWVDYQKHGEVVKDPYHAQKHRTTIVTPQYKTKPVTPLHETKGDAHITTKDEWPSIWASGGDIPSFSHLRKPKHEWGIHHYPTFQSAVNLGYPLHNFRVYISDTNYFYSKFTPIALHDWKNKPVLCENNRGTNALPSGVEMQAWTL